MSFDRRLNEARLLLAAEGLDGMLLSVGLAETTPLMVEASTSTFPPNGWAQRATV